ncbi:probable multifunctional folic acid synthesis protein [Cephalotrichum gorgonifer]|uniref:Folic acid synthesis protein FOL1 n=1 Tax=Cephalotrichum gorgonifer TaxID=2041049 RepID=A0AAE8SSE9_9PEZI|nr:probable multifunctional folic acid synthesis protein [Cephalotrichum gorgonifer]
MATTSSAATPCGCSGAARAGPRLKKAYIALGSNVGDRVAMIEQACREMDSRGIHVLRTSGLWETAPMYVLEQEKFVNGACEVETELEPLALLDALQDIEKALGRVKLIDKGPRSIDLDILMYDNQKVDNERLQVPHVGIPEREFVLRPLAELIPGEPIDPARPWKLAQDYLNELPPSPEPLTPLTPLSPYLAPIAALDGKRKTHIMGILNITPDSFSDGGITTPENLVERLLHFAQSGATMIDVGGQSTSPGTPEATLEEELGRVIPVIKLARKLPQTARMTLSVDTYRAAVAEAAVAAGADIVNDVSAGQLDPAMLPLVAHLGKTVCLMHMRGDPRTMASLTDYPEGLIPTIATDLLARVAEAEAAGIRRWRIVLDPGIGFAKTGDQNLEILRELDTLRRWPGLEGIPWLVGSSRKGFVGAVTGVKTPGERVWGTAATVTAAVQGGADIVRVHDVDEMGLVAKMSDAIWRV